MAAMLAKLPEEEVKKNLELLPGGDIRQKENGWIRAAWDEAQIGKVPRENQIRLVVQKIAKKRRLCTLSGFQVRLVSVQGAPTSCSTLRSMALQLDRV